MDCLARHRGWIAVAGVGAFAPGLVARRRGETISAGHPPLRLSCGRKGDQGSDRIGRGFPAEGDFRDHDREAGSVATAYTGRKTPELKPSRLP